MHEAASHLVPLLPHQANSKYHLNIVCFFFQITKPASFTHLAVHAHMSSLIAGPHNAKHTATCGAGGSQHPPGLALRL